MKIDHVLTIRGTAASVDGVTWTVDPSALTGAEGEELFGALFPKGPGLKWYLRRPADAPLFIDADESLESVEWETMAAGDGPVALTRGVVRVVPGSRGQTLLNLGAAMAMLERDDTAAECYDAAIEAFGAAGDEQGLACALMEAAFLADDGDLLEDAGGYYERALEVARRTGDRETEADALSGLGGLYVLAGLWREAEDCNRQAAEICHEVGDRLGEGRILCDLGCLMLDLGRDEEAQRFFEHSLEIGREQGHVGATTEALCGLAALHHTAGETERALEEICGAMRAGLQHEASDVTSVIWAAMRMAVTSAGRGDWDRVAHLAEALGRQVEAWISEADGPEDIIAAAGVAAVILGVMAAIARAEGDATSPALSQALNVLEEVDAATASALEPIAWFGEMCRNAAGRLGTI